MVKRAATTTFTVIDPTTNRVEFTLPNGVKRQAYGVKDPANLVKVLDATWMLTHFERSLVNSWV